MNSNMINLYEEIQTHLLNDLTPSLYLNDLTNNPLFKESTFKYLYDLQFTKQSPIYHPEGNVWIHTMLVVNEAAKRKHLSKDQKVFMWAALLHDIGKPQSTKIRHGRITSYDHDKTGAKLAYNFLSQFSNDEEFINDVCSLVRYHMHILYVVKDLSYGNIESMKTETDINEVALLGLCDRLGRKNVSIKDEQETVNLFIKKLKLK